MLIEKWVLISSKTERNLALALAQLEHHTVNQKVTGLILGQGTGLGLQVWSPGYTTGNLSMFLSLINVSLPLSLAPFPSL